MLAHIPLHSGDKEFRLVRFVISDPSPLIRLELRHAPIPSGRDNPVPFAAISYLRGDVTNTVEVQVNSKPFFIGQNLHAALGQLRQDGIESWIWVDSVCINQADPEEGWHIHDMRAICGFADVVYLWLGLGSASADQTMDLISRVGPRAFALGAQELNDWQRWHRIKACLKEWPVEPSDHNAADLELA